jgi:hypothetical protein
MKMNIQYANGVVEWDAGIILFQKGSDAHYQII